MTTKRIAVTAGEPAGIGPDLCIQIAQHQHDNELVVIADPDLLKQRAEQMGLSITLCPADLAGPASPAKAGEIHYLPCKLAEPVKPGQLNPANANYVLATLQKALDGCLTGLFAAVVTAPVHKGVINDAGERFSGHTEFFAEGAGVDKVVMMLATPRLRVALATTHLPLADVSNAINQPELTRIITILNASLQTQFGIEQPCIAVCGLNPHAGEGGHLGREEIDVIEPVIKQLQQQGLNLTGPWPADTIFVADRLQDYDAVLAMYHDQGLPVLKHQGFGEAVNITLGLPFIRTSVDHGTALELAATGNAHDSSLRSAVAMAEYMIDQQAATK